MLLLAILAPRRWALPWHRSSGMEPNRYCRVLCRAARRLDDPLQSDVQLGGYGFDLLAALCHLLLLTPPAEPGLAI